MALEQNFLELLRRIEIEWLPCLQMHRLLQPQHLDAEFLALLVEKPRVQQHTVALHGEQHFHHRHFDVAVNVQKFGILFDLGIQHLMQLQRYVRVFGRVLGGASDLHLSEGDAAGSLAGDFVVSDGGNVKMAGGEAVHVVRKMAFQHIGLQQRVVFHPAEHNSTVGEYMLVVLEVLSDFAVARVFQPFLERGKNMIPGELVRRTGISVADGNVRSLTCLHRQRYANQFCRHRIEAGRFGIDGDQGGGRYFPDPGIELIDGEDGFVFSRSTKGAHRILA